VESKDWPPRFTITYGGLAGMYLRRFFGDAASGDHIEILAALFDSVAHGYGEADVIPYEAEESMSRLEQEESSVGGKGTEESGREV